MLRKHMDKLDEQYAAAAVDCALKVGGKGVVSAEDSPHTFFRFVIGVMRSFAAEGIASRFPELSELPTAFNIGDSSDENVPDMLFDELKYLVELYSEKKYKRDPDVVCLLICYLAYFNSLATNEEGAKLQDKLFRRIELVPNGFSGYRRLMYSTALWFADRRGFRERFRSALAERKS